MLTGRPLSSERCKGVLRRDDRSNDNVHNVNVDLERRQVVLGEYDS